MFYYHCDGKHTYNIQDGPEKVVRMFPLPSNFPAAVTYLGKGYDVQLGSMRPFWHMMGRMTGQIYYDSCRPVLNDLDERYGGWHSMTRLDLKSWALTCMASKFWGLARKEESKERNAAIICKARDICDCVEDHPLWPYLDIYRLMPMPMGLVIGLIGDPRWYVNPRHPTRASSLKRRFGLEGLRYDDGCVPESPLQLRYQALFNARFHKYRPIDDAFAKVSKHVFSDFDPSGVTICNLMENVSSRFLIAVRAELSRILMYVRLIWLSLIYPDQPFYPEKFFRHEIDILYFKHHTSGGWAEDILNS